MFRTGYRLAQYLFYLLLPLVFNGCGFSEDYCIDPDDFGFPKISTSAEYSSDEVYGACPNQYVKWDDTKLVLNGEKIVAYVSGGNWNPYGITYKYKVECTFYNDDPSSDADIDGYADILNGPCVLKNGAGLYMLFAPDGTNPNETLLTIQKPDENGFSTYHMGANDAYYAPRGKTYSKGINSSPEGVGGSYNDRVYMKILDTCYTDNSGSYTVTFKSGVASANISAFIQPLIDTVRGQLDSVYKNVFSGLVKNSSFVNYIRILIILFIVYRAYLFLMGKVRGSLGEFVADILKAAIVATLISNYAWDFFYDYLFSIFINGVDDLISIFAPNSFYGNSYYDLLIQSMITKELWYKILAIMNLAQTHSFFGLVFGILMIWAIGMFIYATLVAAIFYLLSLIGVGILVAVSPIFISMMLFEETKELFKKWYEQLFIYLLQPVLVFAFLVFFFDMIYGVFHNYLGIRVCSVNMLGSWGTLRGLAPDYNLDGDNYFGTISIPEAFYDGDKYCSAYECEGERWYDAPYLDPEDEWDENRLKELRNNEVATFLDVLYVWVLITLLIQFQQGIPALVAAMIRGRFFSWQTFGKSGGAWGGAGEMLGAGGNIASGVKNIGMAYMDRKEGAPTLEKSQLKHSSGRRIASYIYGAGAGVSNMLRNPTRTVGNIIRPDISLPNLGNSLSKELRFWDNKTKAEGAEKGRIHEFAEGAASRMTNRWGIRKGAEDRVNGVFKREDEEPK